MGKIVLFKEKFMQSRRLSTLDIPKKEKRVKRFNTQDVNLLMQKLATRTVEKDVEDAWREF
ncbi:hypothetical protein ERJ63_04680 [Lactobacillus helveticus]|nr:hypothetical protein [Lactobacillus helveticus]